MKTIVVFLAAIVIAVGAVAAVLVGAADIPDERE